MSLLLKNGKKEVTFKPGTSISDMVSSFEDDALEMTEQSVGESEIVSADAGVLNEEIADLDKEIVSIENHIDTALDVVDEDVEDAAVAETIAEGEEVPSMESFAALADKFNSRTARIFGRGAAVMYSSEAAEDFKEGTTEEKKGKFRQMASAAGNRVKQILISILNALKAFAKKINEIRLAIFDKATRLKNSSQKMAKELSKDVAKETNVPASKAVKRLSLDGKMDIAAMKTVEKVAADISAYQDKLVSFAEGSLENYMAFTAEKAKNFVLGSSWTNVGDYRVLHGVMPGGIALVGTSAEGENDTMQSYALEVIKEQKDEITEVKLLNRQQRAVALEIVRALAEQVIESKAKWKGIDKAIKSLTSNTEKLMKEGLKADGVGMIKRQGETKKGVAEVTADIRALVKNIRVCSYDMNKYAIGTADALLAVVAEHDKLAGKEDKDAK